MECTDPTQCGDNASCVDYVGYHFCFATCDGDEACRDQYVCDYHTCRPPCNRDDRCHEPDTCFNGHCKAKCTANTDCLDNSRCQDGKCVPPCTQHEDCLPGFSCNTGSGQCEPKPGFQMGETCAHSGECATGYCLPTRKICSIQCNGTAICPSDYRCGLEKIDSKATGNFDLAEAACVPAEGAGEAGQACDRDQDCASFHCYYGFCMEGCAQDGDCGANQCVEVNLLLGGGIPKYKGCLPRQGTSTYTLGKFNDIDYHGFDIPPTARSFVLSTEVASTTEMPLVYEVKGPSGEALYTLATDSCGLYSEPNRFLWGEQYSSLFVPNTPAVTLTPGVHAYMVGATQANIEITTRLQLKLGQAVKGTLNINWVFLNLQGTCVTGDTMNAASAPTHPWFTKVRDSTMKILGQAGLSLGAETFEDLNDPNLDVIVEMEGSVSKDLQLLFSSSAGKQGPSINVFFVRKIEVGNISGGVILGIAGGIPGPISHHGRVHSGIVISMETACYEPYGYDTGQTVAHEMGHYLGLFHNQESETVPGVSEQEVVCPCPCGANMSCYQGWGGTSWCRGEDGIPDTTISHDNLMFFAAESAQEFEGSKLSPGQIQVILNNPIVGH